MKHTQPKTDCIKPNTTLHMAMELSAKKWGLLFSDGAYESTVRARHVTIPAADLERLQLEIEKARKRFKLEPACRVVSCYEAGRDGFWIDRALRSLGVENTVLDPASIETNQRKRRVKTDRVDVHALLDLLVRYWRGEKVLSVVPVPSVEEEDIRHLTRERESLLKESKRLKNQITSHLCTHGVIIGVGRHFLTELEKARQFDGSPLPEHVQARVTRLYELLAITWRQIRENEREKKRLIKDDGFMYAGPIRLLLSVRGIGMVTAWVLVTELFGWREFHNRGEVGAAVGLTSTPYNSGTINREQGISKAGNKRVRSSMVELAWLWLRYQPNSRSSIWFQKKWGGASKREKKKGITALARRLLIEFWHLTEYGALPEGAVM